MNNPWVLTYEGYDPAEERLRESLCALGNGYFATRGAAPEVVADAIHYPGTYVAGYYNRLVDEVAGKTITNESLVNAPNWLPLTFKANDSAWFDIDRVEILDFTQELDIKAGVLKRQVRFRDELGQTTQVAQRRIVHMAHRHLAALETTVTPEDWSGTLRFRSGLEGRVANVGIERYRTLSGDHLTFVNSGESATDGRVIYLQMEAKTSHVRFAEAARTTVYRGDEDVPVRRELHLDGAFIAHEFEIDVAEGEAITVEKVVSLFGSRDRATEEPGIEARNHASRAGSFGELLAFHTLIWAHLWDSFGISVGDKDEDQCVACILNLHVFHLLQTVSKNSIDLDVGVPARGLHGEAYRGHVFWDEMFIFPSISLHLPELTRGLLQYRYRRLPEARWRAWVEGYRGALYPWQSGSSGREESQEWHLNPRAGTWVPDNSHLQRHINIAVAFNVWSYYSTTGDTEFLDFEGAEMLLEIARFWASIATYNRTEDRYEILGVMGPDEYHDAYEDADKPGLDNNAYTNIMAVWCLKRAVGVLDVLPFRRRQELREQLSLERGEIELWEDISRKMKVVFHEDGVISQFEGYEQLDEFDWEGYREKYGDIQRLDRILGAEGTTPNRYKLSKQADVLMLFFLLSTEEVSEIVQGLGYEWAQDLMERTIDYYMQRTSHGSTLSRVVHSWVLARRDRTGSWQLFKEALESDVSDIQGGTTAEGIHLGAMAGTVDIIQRCYTGMEVHEDALWLNPMLPDGLTRIEMNLQYRGMLLHLQLTHDTIAVTSDAGESAPCRVRLGTREFEVQPGQTIEAALP